LSEAKTANGAASLERPEAVGAFLTLIGRRDGSVAVAWDQGSLRPARQRQHPCGERRMPVAAPSAIHPGSNLVRQRDGQILGRDGRPVLTLGRDDDGNDQKH
jgi:hypothetical protein